MRIHGRPRLSIVGLALCGALAVSPALAQSLDRGGFLFHGKIKALADAAREGGLKF
jgi:large subunit ribosomal protein L18